VLKYTRNFLYFNAFFKGRLKVDTPSGAQEAEGMTKKNSTLPQSLPSKEGRKRPGTVE
jgi:hypothetical protein